MPVESVATSVSHYREQIWYYFRMETIETNVVVKDSKTDVCLLSPTGDS